jgi:ABC-type Fe3+ transport system permease subunit
MSWWKRLLLSLVSAIAAELLASAIITLVHHDNLSSLFATAIGLAIFVIPGWLLSLPIVLAFNRVDGWRFWTLAIAGIAIGPLIIGAWAYACKVSEGSAIRDFVYMGGIATGISIVATAMYLTIFRNSVRNSIQPTT